MTAKKKPGTDVAVATSTAPAIVPSTLPAYLQGYQGRLGTEDMEAGDFIIPRLKIGQAMTPAVKNGDLAEGDIYLNLDDEVLAGPGEPLPVVVLSRWKEYILWRPREDNGGGILARAHAVKLDGVKRFEWDKPNQSFDVKVGGKVKVTWATRNFIDEDGLDQYGSEIPGDPESGIAATVHHNYILALPSFDNQLAAASLAKSGVRRAKKFNALLKRQCEAKHIPTWSLLFNLSSDDDKNTAGDEFKNYLFKNAGFVPEADMAFYTGLAETLASKIVNIDQSDGVDEPATKRTHSKAL